jgi:hypothetical protein
VDMRQNRGFLHTVWLLSTQETSYLLDSLCVSREDRKRGKSQSLTEIVAIISDYSTALLNASREYFLMACHGFLLLFARLVQFVAELLYFLNLGVSSFFEHGEMFLGTADEMG